MGTRGICLYLVLSLLILTSAAFAQSGCQIDFLASQSFLIGSNPLIITGRTADLNHYGKLNLIILIKRLILFRLLNLCICWI